MSSTPNEFPDEGVDLGAVAAAVVRALPGSTVLSVARFGEATGDESDRVAHGEPVLIRVAPEEGETFEVVFQTKCGPTHQRAVRAADSIMAFDGAAWIPGHARALDVGMVREDGAELLSVATGGEFYVLSEYIEGQLYADELRAVATRGELLKGDLERVTELAQALADVHELTGSAEQYRFSVRETFAGEEGILGVIDGFSPGDTPGAPRMILDHLERLGLPWRWKLRDYEHRCCRVHGDFNPFNAVFSERGLRLLEGRGVPGEAAGDVVEMSLHYVFFGLLWPGTWKPCFRRLWNAYWNTYLGETGDSELLEVVAPYFLQASLSLCSPTVYPGTPPAVRERLLTLAEQVLGAARFDPGIVETLFREEGPPSTR
jgi:hypothetical protein